MFIPIIMLVFGSVALSLAADYDRNGIAAWEEFKTKYSMEYGSIDEEIFRRHVFLENFEQFYNHNLKYEKGEVSFKIGTNQFADMTPEEMRSFTKCLILSSETEWNILEKHQQNFSTEIPKAVDWRNEGAVTPVKDQRNCGSCWAFSATGALEGQHAIKTKTLVSLSEQNLVDCDKYDHSCHGGDFRTAFKYVSEKGIDTEESYPYEAKQGACRFNPNNVIAKDMGARQVDPQEAALKAAVATVGPISVAIDASDHHFNSYTGGIYTSSTCSSDIKNADHAVLVVGYGTTPKGEDYWLVKNSWGHGWGEKGFIRMAMHKNICGIANHAIYPVM